MGYGAIKAGNVNIRSAQPIPGCETIARENHSVHPQPRERPLGVPADCRFDAVSKQAADQEHVDFLCVCECVGYEQGIGRDHHVTTGEPLRERVGRRPGTEKHRLTILQDLGGDAGDSQLLLRCDD